MSYLLLWLVFIVGGVVEFATVPKAHGQAFSHHIPAGGQALACKHPDEQLDCKMFMAGFTDMMNVMLIDGESSKMLCGSLDTPDLIAEFDEEARKTPQADTDAVLFRLLKTNHLCERKPVQPYRPTTAGELNDLCHSGDAGFQLCSEYQGGVLEFIFFTSEQTKLPILCGDMRILTNATAMLSNELEADYKLRQKPAVSLMFGALQKHLPCAKSP